jgi:hypothetical protein
MLSHEHPLFADENALRQPQLRAVSLRLYEATLYERRTLGDAQPVRFEGREVSREFVAETASKARYRFWTELRDAWDEVRIQDIRVRSLSKETPRQPLEDGWEKRLEQVNAIIQVIGSHGRRFLSENSDRREPVADPFFAYFTVDQRNEIWFVDRYSRKPILIRHRDWEGFSDGGTLRSLVEHFARYIYGGAKIETKLFGPWPTWICGGDPWGYGADEMERVRRGVAALLEGHDAGPR